MVIDTKEKPLTKKIDLLEVDSGYCSDCDYFWCLLKNKIIYCNMKFRGVKGYYCSSEDCNID